MRKNPTKKAERYRISTGYMSSDKGNPYGAFRVPYGLETLAVIVSDGSDWDELGLPGAKWEHVSVTTSDRGRCPTWDEMCYVKRLFWKETETVLQVHVPKDKHVNFHPTCLHLWKPVGVEIPLPPTETVGPM